MYTWGMKLTNSSGSVITGLTARLVNDSNDITLTEIGSTGYYQSDAIPEGFYKLYDNRSGSQADTGIPVQIGKVGIDGLGDIFDDTLTKINNKYSIDILAPAKNKYNPDLALVDKYYNNSDGAEISHTDWWCTGKIPVEPGKSYVLSSNSNDGFVPYIHGYNASGAWLFNQTSASFTATYSVADKAFYFTAPAGCYFVASTVDVTNITESFETWRNSLQLEEGTARTDREEYTLKLNTDMLPSEVVAAPDEITAMKTDRDLVVVKDGIDVYIRSSYNTQKDIVIRVKLEYNDNGIFNFYRASLVNKSTGNSVGQLQSGTEIHFCSDDVPAHHLNDIHLGGNHGAMAFEVTETGHGKTADDLGSLWADVYGKRFYLLKVIDSDRLLFISENTGTGDVWVFNTAMDDALTHVSGAINTSAIDITSVASVQLRPSLRKNYLTLEVHGKEIDADGTYYGNSLNIAEQYEITDPTEIKDTVPGVLTYITPTKVVTNTINYRFFDRGVCRIDSTVVLHKAVNLDFICFVMSAIIKDIDDSIHLYLPGVKAFTSEGTNLDFGSIQEADFSGAALITNTELQDVSKPNNRTIMLSKDGSVFVTGYAIGLLPFDAGTDSNILANSDNYWSVSASKIYARPVYNFGQTTAGQVFTASAYRVYFDPQEYQKPTCVYLVPCGSATYLYADYHTACVADSIKLPEKYQGKEIEIIDKSDSMNVHNTVVTSAGVVVSVSNISVYSNSYLVAKLV